MNSAASQETLRCFNELHDDATELYSKWRVFCQLFATSEERIKLLNQSAPNAFSIIHDSLRDDILMSLCRLTDPPVTSGHNNLVLDHLINLVTFPPDWRALFDTIRSNCDAVRKHRNKRIGHRSLKVEKLPDITRRALDTAVNGVAELINLIGNHIGAGIEDFAQMVIKGDGDSLIMLLERASSLRRGKSLARA